MDISFTWAAAEAVLAVAASEASAAAAQAVEEPAEGGNPIISTSFAII